MNKMRENIYKSQKGITLLALVITIIVLIILAGVGISLVTGDGGIIGRTKNAKETADSSKDNEENRFTLFQEMEEDEKKISAWDCIIDAVAYVSRAAYENEGIKYLPETIEIVDDNIFTHMVQSLTLCDSMECEYIEKVYKKCLEEVK